VGPVLDAIVQTASTLCNADNAYVFQLYRDKYHVMAYNQRDPDYLKHLMQNPIDPDQPGSITARAARERVAIHIPDTIADPEYRFQSGHARARQALKGRGAGGAEARTLLSVPLLREGEPIGVITMDRAPVRPFSIKEVELVTTFADQAVIAIENTRLFEEVQERTRELTEALEQQTATADVLKVISRSALDVQKVLDALVESAARLCDAYDAAIYQVLGDRQRLVAHYGQIALAGPVGQHTISLLRGFVGGRAVIDRRTIHVADVLAEADEYPESRNRALQSGYRTALGVPLVHAGEARRDLNPPHRSAPVH
jgi:two-component system, NtrC family, sensor kinase